MYDTIYVPLVGKGTLEERVRAKEKLVAELYQQGWHQHDIVELRNSLKEVIPVLVLMRDRT